MPLFSLIKGILFDNPIYQWLLQTLKNKSVTLLIPVFQKYDVTIFHTQFSIYCLLKKQSFSQIALFSPYSKMSIIVKCFRLITIYNHLSKKPFIRSYAVKSIYKEKRGENWRLYGLLWEKQKSFQFRWRWCY